MNRRDFLKTTAMGLVTAGVAASPLLGACAGKPKKGRSGKLNLTFEPYDLKLIHPFTVAVNTRTHTPDVQVQLEYDGVIGYGEASMPPYLGDAGIGLQIPRIARSRPVRRSVPNGRNSRIRRFGGS